MTRSIVLSMNQTSRPRAKCQTSTSSVRVKSTYPGSQQMVRFSEQLLIPRCFSGLFSNLPNKCPGLECRHVEGSPYPPEYLCPNTCIPDSIYTCTILHASTCVHNTWNPSVQILFVLQCLGCSRGKIHTANTTSGVLFFRVKCPTLFLPEL